MSDFYEQCRSNLEKLVLWYQDHVADRNEATTRLHLIDHLFMRCLAWTADDVIAEESHDGQYSDYTFLAPRRVLIVEAKKEGAYFEVPAGTNHLEYSLRTISRDNPSLKTALEQVADYCQNRGTPLGAVCNGHQLVVFVATRNDGVAPLDGRALVFPSLESMLESFLDLWNALSKPGVEERKLLDRLLGARSLEIPAKLSTSISGYPGMKLRNIFQTDLQIVSELVLEDIIRLRDMESDFLKECYCQSGALSQYALISKAILGARYAALFDAESSGPTMVSAVERQGVSADLLAESLSGRPILLIGDVGVGKTTFIRHLLKVDAVDLFQEAIALYIDLGSQATLTYDLREFILEEIANQLRDEYHIDVEDRNFIRGVYHFDLERFGHGLYSDLRETRPEVYLEKEIKFLEDKIQRKEIHIKKSLEHLVKGRKKQVVIFLDNVDQRQDEVQQQAFLISQELATHWPVTVFVALRPPTFHRSRKTGALSGYHPKAFFISPPRIDRVLEKRLIFALKITSGLIPIRGLADDIRIRLGKLDTIIQVFLESIEQNDSLIEFLDNISGGNVRTALELVKDFFSSGHVDTRKIVDIYEETGSYNVPLHELLRAVIYGDSQHYDPSRSIVANLYDISCSDPKEHFLLPILLTLLATVDSSKSKDGFIETTMLYETIQGLGFTPRQIDAAIVRAHRHNLIETGARKVPYVDQPMPSVIRATTIGAYHVTRLCRFFAYHDAISVDTPILDSAVRVSIRNVMSIGERLDRAEEFRKYLNQQWTPMIRKEAFFHWPSVSLDIQKEIFRIRERVGRQRARTTDSE